MSRPDFRKKYICYGGTVTSKHDNEEHYINSHEVAMLYEVNPMRCYFVDNEDDYRTRGLDVSGLIPLRPNSDGNYTLYPKMIHKVTLVIRVSFWERLTILFTGRLITIFEEKMLK